MANTFTMAPNPCLGSNGPTGKTQHSALTPEQIQGPEGGPGAHQSPLFPRVRRQASGTIGEAVGAARGWIFERFAGSVAPVEPSSRWNRVF